MSILSKIDPLSDPLGNFLSAWRNQAVLPYIQGKHIDIACGSNKLAKTYGGVGVDIADYGGNALIVADMSKLPFVDGEFDTATIVASLYCFAEPLPILREVVRILRPDGQLILTMLNTEVLQRWYRWRAPGDKLVYYSDDELTQLLAVAGLKIAKRHRFMFGLNSIYIVRKV